MDEPDKSRHGQNIVEVDDKVCVHAVGNKYQGERIQSPDDDHGQERQSHDRVRFALHQRKATC